MQASTPFSQILGRYVIVIVVSMRTFALCPMKLMFRHPTALAVSRLVDNDNEFMMACDRGDTLAVRAMLRDGRGRPTDVAERNWTPLTVSETTSQILVMYSIIN